MSTARGELRLGPLEVRQPLSVEVNGAPAQACDTHVAASWVARVVVSFYFCGTAGSVGVFPLCQDP